MNKYNCFPFWQNYIWLTWQALYMQSESEARSMQHLSHGDLRFRVLAPNPAHIPGAPFFTKMVSHQ